MICSAKTKSIGAFCVAGVLFATVAAIILIAATSAAHTKLTPSPLVGEPLYQDIEGESFPVVDWDYWLDINPAVIGWVTIPGTSIDTAIVQAPPKDPRYYLSHDIYGNRNAWGVPYLSAECFEEGLGSQNAVVYGHNMTRTGTPLFGELANNLDASYAVEHRTVLLQTPEWKQALQLQCVEVVQGSSVSKRVQFRDANDFTEWYTERFAASKVRLSEEVKVPEQVLSLVTCSYTQSNNERTVSYACTF